jgi:lysophospholipase L1-like esterase
MPRLTACLWCRPFVRAICAGPLCSLLVVVGVVVVRAGQTGDDDDPSPTSDPDRPLMVAIGDSFMSGEGAPRYFSGTNTKANSCHRARTAYPYLVADEFDFRLVFAACSGAVAQDVVGPHGQHPDSPEDVLGGKRQLDALLGSAVHEDPDDVDVVLISLGGNDAGFGELVRTCLDRQCLDQATRWLDGLDDLSWRLADVYQSLRELVPTARVLIVTYPQPFVLPSCLGPLDDAELTFVLNQFLPRLNEIIDFQATMKGFEVVKATDAFVGARLCEDGERTDGRAMNVFTAARPSDGRLPNPSGSFHPTPLGHMLLAQEVVVQLKALPAPASAACPTEMLCPPVPPPFVPPEVGPPTGPYPFPEGTTCPGSVIDRVRIEVLQVDQAGLLVQGRPRSIYCFAAYQSTFRSGRIDGDGGALIDVRGLAVASTRLVEVLVEVENGRWEKIVAFPPPSVTPDPAPLQSRWLFWLCVAGVAVLAIALLPWLICRRCRSRSSELADR